MQRYLSCPYCDHEHSLDKPYFYNKELESMDCDNCGQEFLISVYIDWKWEAYCYHCSDTGSFPHPYLRNIKQYRDCTHCSKGKEHA